MKLNFGVWLRLGRVSNLPTVWSNSLAGLCLSGAVWSWPLALSLCTIFSVFYVAGMFLNDAFDRHVDARERPDRPIPAGLISARTVFAVGFGALAVAVLAVAYLAGLSKSASPAIASLSALGLTGAIVGYDAFHKNNPLSPVLMGLCRVLVYFTAALTVQPSLSLGVLVGAGLLLCHLIGLTYTAKQENLNRLGSLWPLALLFVAPVYGVGGSGGKDFLLLATSLLLGGWLINALRFLMGGRRIVPAAVVRMIAGISLLDALLIAAAGSMELALLAAAFCALTRLLQRFVPGT